MEEQSHATDAKVTVTIANAVGCVNLRIRPQVPNTLYVNDDQLVSGALKCEMTECLSQIQQGVVVVCLYDGRGNDTL